MSLLRSILGGLTGGRRGFGSGGWNRGRTSYGRRSRGYGRGRSSGGLLGGSMGRMAMGGLSAFGLRRLFGGGRRY